MGLDTVKDCCDSTVRNTYERRTTSLGRGKRQVVRMQNLGCKVATIGHKELWRQMLLTEPALFFFDFWWTLYLRNHISDSTEGASGYEIKGPINFADFRLTSLARGGAVPGLLAWDTVRPRCQYFNLALF